MHSDANDEEKPHLERPLLGATESASTPAPHSRLPIIGAEWRNRAKVYGCHLMASWGDRMWLFAIGLYMIKLYPESLRLPAIYGITLSGSILVFGSFIGAWIDRTHRITAARVALIVQNSIVALCALLLVGVIMFRDKLASWGPWASPLSQALIVFIADIAALASETSRIILQKDWIVVISSDDHALLAGYNSVMRAIDLGSNILAPTCVGFLMSWMSSVSAALFLCIWNVVSMILEYILLNNIFKTFPNLAIKNQDLSAVHDAAANARTDDVEGGEAKEDQGNEISGWLTKAILGWGVYFRHNAFAAGLGLALLYMTVLGFDNITTAFAYSQGVEPWMLGVMSGMGALTGMTGALCFPFLCNCLGLRKTGILGFSMETVMLSASLVSIILPGSPFKYYVAMQTVAPTNQEANWTLAGLHLVQGQHTQNCNLFCEGDLKNVTSQHSLTIFNDTVGWTTAQNPSSYIQDNMTIEDHFGIHNGTKKRQESADYPHGTENPIMMMVPPEEGRMEVNLPVMTTLSPMKEVAMVLPIVEKPADSVNNSRQIDISILTFLGGIIAARFGLWVADLTVTQILQEEVREDQRGMISGVQTSMNQLLNLVKFVLVVLMPQTELFGYLIIASNAFVCLGWISFMVYCIRTMYRPGSDIRDDTQVAINNGQPTQEVQLPLQDQNKPLFKEVPITFVGSSPSHVSSKPLP